MSPEQWNKSRITSKFGRALASTIAAMMPKTKTLVRSCNQKIVTLFIFDPTREVISARTAKYAHHPAPFHKLHQDRHVCLDVE